MSGPSAPLPAGFRGLFTTRAGGVSAGPWARLNLAPHVGDDSDHVAANRRMLAAWLGVDRVRFPEQVHGAGVRVCTADEPDSAPGDGADALVTPAVGVAIGVLVADCLPVLLADPGTRIVAAAHAGRRGLAAGVLQATVTAMADLGADPGRTVATIGPAIGGCCYEVPAAIRDEVAATIPGAAARTSWGALSLDLPAGAVQVLRGAGVEHVHRIPSCTFTDERFYSYRREGRTGRFAGVVMAA